MADEESCGECFEASYTDRDVILYALSIGFGGDQERSEKDLKYVWEAHEEFTLCPTFCLVLIFWATQRKNEGSVSLPPFPPPLMAHTEIMPQRFLKADIATDLFPTIHTYQSITWTNQALRIPKRGEFHAAQLRQNIVAVTPKSVGTFVTTKTAVHQGANSPICAMVSTMLVLGIPSGLVKPFVSKDAVVAMARQADMHARLCETSPTYQVDVIIDHTAALLYRLASGDTNHIHVDANAMPQFRKNHPTAKTLPLLHGLCTLGIVARVLLQHENVSALQRLEAEFSKPIMVGDCLVMQFWKVDSYTLLFRVKNRVTGDLVVKNGFVALPISRRAPVCVRQARL